MFKTRKEIVELEERILVLEKRLEDYKKDMTWQIQWETKIRKDFDQQIVEDLLRIKKQLKKKSGKE